MDIFVQQVKAGHRMLIEWQMAGVRSGKPYIEGFWMDDHGSRHYVREDIKTLQYTPSVQRVDCVNGEKYILS